MNDLIKKVVAFALGTLLFLNFTVPAFAQATPIDPCPSNSNQFFKLCGIRASNIGRVIQTAVSVILVIAVLISLFYLILGGIRWVTSGGDKAKVESARSTIIAAIIGLVIAFLAYFILSLLLSVFGFNLGNLQLPSLT